MINTLFTKYLNLIYSSLAPFFHRFSDCPCFHESCQPPLNNWEWWRALGPRKLLRGNYSGDAIINKIIINLGPAPPATGHGTPPPARKSYDQHVIFKYLYSLFYSFHIFHLPRVLLVTFSWELTTTLKQLRVMKGPRSSKITKGKLQRRRNY